MTIRQVAREAAGIASLTWPATCADTGHYADTLADAVTEAVLREVEGALRRHEHEARRPGADPVTRAYAQGFREAADDVRDLRASLASEPVTMWEAKP